MKDVMSYLEDVQKLEFEAKRCKQMVDIQNWITSKNLQICFTLDHTGFKIFPSNTCPLHKKTLLKASSDPTTALKNPKGGHFVITTVDE